MPDPVIDRARNGARIQLASLFSVTNDLPRGVRFSPTGLTLPDDLTLDGWQGVGAKLQQYENAIQWWLGDWWHFGFHKYGERAKATAKGTFRATFGTLMNYGWVAGKVEPSLRNEVLSWSHHAAVAPYEPEEQKKLLTKAAKRKLSVASLRQEIFETLMLSDDERASQYAYRLKQAAISWNGSLLILPVLETELLQLLPPGTIAELQKETAEAAAIWEKTNKGLREFSRAVGREEAERKTAVRVRPQQRDRWRKQQRREADHD